MNLDPLWDLLKGLLANPGVGVSTTPPTFAPAIAQRPPVIPHPSPNYKRTPGRLVTCVIIHATATEGVQSPLNELCDPKPAEPEKRVSAHYVIDKNGLVYQLVHEEDVAWHAGVSYWQGRAGVNAFSVGLELVNRNDGVDPYPEPQLAAAAQLTRAICAERGIQPSDVVGHADIAPGRKTDPGAAFPWPSFRERCA